MKKKLLPYLLFTMVVAAFAEKPVQVIHNPLTVGQNHVLRQEISGMEYILPERIDNYYIDTASYKITFQLRGVSKNGKWLNNSGDVLLYDLKNKQVNWSKKIYYQQSSIDQYDNVIIQANQMNCSRLNNETGENTWESKDQLYYVEPVHQIGLGYKFSTWSGNTEKLEGIDLTNGQKLWERVISREYGWNRIYHLNDSVLLVSASGLHTINLNNGKGWDYNLVTGIKDYSKTVALNVLGITAAILTGSGMVATGHDLLTNVLSNALIDSGSICMASRNTLSKVDYEGNLIWGTSLPEKQTGASTLFRQDSILYLVNWAYGNMGRRTLPSGTPYIAAFNANTGTQIYLDTIAPRKTVLNAFIIDNKSVICCSKDKVISFDLTNGTKIAENNFDSNVIGELRTFAGNSVYQKNADSITYQSLYRADSTLYYIYTDKGKILALDHKLNLVKQLDYQNLYKYNFQKNNLRFISQGNQTIILDKDYRKIAGMSVSPNAVMIDRKLYDIQKDSFIEVDLTGLLKE